MRRIWMLGLVALITIVLVLPVSIARLSDGPPATPHVGGSDSLLIKVFVPEHKQILELPLGEYLKGVVAAEMPATFAREALSAQFIVARTYAVRRMQKFSGPGKGGCPLNAEADICADPATGQAYMNQEQAKKQLGEAKAQAYWQVLGEIQAVTDGLVLLYQGELIDPLYHSVSGTYTADAGDYFNQALPYLKSVDDHWGATSPRLKESRRFSAEALAKALSTPAKPLAVPVLAGSLQKGQVPVQVLTRSSAGRVTQVKVGDKTLTGREFRERLGLRSTNFTVSLENGEVVVNTTGYGHGVGMSQYGANGMAQEGKTYQQILTHYYQGVTISRLFGDQ